MKNIIFYSIIFTALCVYGCDDDDNTNPDPMLLPYQEIGIVTGLDLLDANGQPLGRWRVPNHKNGVVSVFPIPNNGVFSMIGNQTIKEIWLVPASCAVDSTTMNIDELAQNLTFSVSEVAAIAVKNVDTSGSGNQITVDFADVSNGFYKVFFDLTTDGLRWQNIYIDDNFSGMPNFETLDNACN